MRVLLCNDDGIHAPGIQALHQHLARTLSPDELFTVAPATVQSATSHGITFTEPLMTETVDLGGGYGGIAVDGRPADCIKLALSELWPDRFGAGAAPDLVVSGMNAGANCGINVIYSGTVAAAIEAAFLGIPSIAVSLHLGRGPVDFDEGARQGVRAIHAVLASNRLAPHECLNINVPRCESEGDCKPAGDLPISVCPMNTHGVVDRYDRRQTPWGKTYYWPAAGGLDFHKTDAGTDVDRLFARHITVTPLSFDLTRHADLVSWADALKPADDAR
ncbi:MAG: 5'/3'-nucleotidase SurE [Planctomycetota bacterium]